MKRCAAAAAVFLLALAVRALGWPLVFEGDRVVPVGYDAYYHLRRSLYSLVEFPATLDFDPYLNFPVGARAIWSPVYDWLLAALALPFVDPADTDSLWRLAVWVPPLLGATTALVLLALVRRHFGGPEAWLAATLLALSSGHFWYSQLGFVDHHAAVALIATGAVYAAMNLVAALEADRPAFVPAAVAGVLFAGSLLVWPGSLLHVGLLEAALLVFLATRPDRRRARAAAAALALANAVAVACVLPLCWNSVWPQWGPFSPVVLTRFQPWLFGAVAITAAACGAAWRRPGVGATRRSRAISGAALGAAVLVASALLLPGLAAGALDAWVWFARRESFQSVVAESWPLFRDPDGGFVWGVAALRLGGFVFLAPAAMAWIAWKRRRSGAVLLFLAWGTGLLLATVLQRRFFNTSAVAVSALFAVSLVAAWRGLPRRWREGHRPLALAGFATGTVLLLAPSLVGYRLFVASQVQALTGARIALTPEMVTRRIALETAAWLAVATPPTSGWLDAAGRPEYGVMAPWTLGHIIETVARRPTVVTNFGDDLGSENFAKMQQYYRGSEATGAALLDGLKVRYVIAQRGHRFLGSDPPAPGSLFHSLWFLDGSRAAGAARPEVLALSRHRLVYESQPLNPGARFTPALFKVFEFVPGARLVGRGRPGARVVARVDLHSNWRRPFTYETAAVIAADGTFSLRVPYATQGSPPSVTADGAYALTCDGISSSHHVNEAVVQSGAPVEVADACR